MLLSAETAFAQGQAFGRRVLTAPGGTSLMDDSQLRQPRLFWKSGEFMDGQLTSADEHSLSFSSDLFTEPAVLDLSALARLDFPPSASAMPGDRAADKPLLIARQPLQELFPQRGRRSRMPGDALAIKAV